MDIYRIYSLAHSNQGASMKRMLARFVIVDGQLIHLEDHLDGLQRILPEGPVSQQTLIRMNRLKMHGYFKLVNENSLGNWKQMVPNLDLGEILPDHAYQVTDTQGKLVGQMSFYEDQIFLNEKIQAGEDREKLLEKIRSGQYHIQEI